VRAEARRQLKEDRFSRATIDVAESAAHWSVEHKSTLIAAAIVLAVLVLAGLGGWYYLSNQNEKASLAMTEAVRTMETPVRPAGAPPQPEFPSFASSQERTAASQKQLTAIVASYPHTHTADVARYFLGTMALEAGDNATAERDLKDVSGTYNADLSSLAKLNLANLYASTKRTKEALELYQQLANKPTMAVSKVAAELKLAALFESSQQPSEAKRIYQQIQHENPGSEAAALAQSKLQELK